MSAAQLLALLGPLIELCRFRGFKSEILVRRILYVQRMRSKNVPGYHLSSSIMGDCGSTFTSGKSQPESRAHSFGEFQFFFLLPSGQGSPSYRVNCDLTVSCCACTRATWSVQAACNMTPLTFPPLGESAQQCYNSVLGCSDRSGRLTQTNYFNVQAGGLS